MSATIHVTTNSPASLAATTDKFVHAISPTVELNDVENGTELIVTDINGEHSAVIHDGYTPQKGVDYWTEEDQAEIQAAIDDVEDAVTAANAATRNAMDAYSSAKNAATSANSAASSANNASAAARDATQRAQSAATTANNAAGTANTAAGNANTAAARANTAASMIEHLEAEAETLPAGSEATASFENNKITFGIPVGGKGDKGDPGEDYVLTEQDKAEIAQMTIDDTAAAGTTDKTWSADKIAAEIAAGTGVLVELNIARDGTVTTEASVADILADIEAGKHVYGLGHIEGNVGTTANTYAPMLAVDIGGLMSGIVCTFNIMEGKIQVMGAAMGGRDTWQMQMQMTMKAATASLEDRAESFDAMDLPISNVGAPVNATDAATKQYVDEHAGGGTVTDVQVNGTSVLSEGVANIPYASASNAGVIKVAARNGVQMNANGEIFVTKANSTHIKNDSGVTTSALSPADVKGIAFYGLSNAAGDTTQHATTYGNFIYTPEAKSAVQSMLGVSSMLAPSETEGSGASRNYAVGETFTMNGKLYKATIAITENDVITSGVNCAETNVADSKADKTDTVLNTTLSMGRKTGTTVGYGSTALGSSVEASGAYSFATGYNTKASGSYAHAEGQSTEATQTESHAEGNYTHATNTAAHAEGNNTNAKGYYSHAEGDNTNANYEAAHAEGSYTTAGYRAHAEGYQTTATGEGSHAEGGNSQATAEYSHAEGYRTTASGSYAHSEGNNTTASGIDSHTEGYGTQATVLYAHAEGNNTLAAAPEAHAEGYYTKATNEASHAEGNYTEASGYYSHAEGYQTKASGTNAHAEGSYTIAPGTDSHASGRYNKMDLYPDWVSGTEYKVGDCVLYSYVGYKCKTANTDENFTASKWDQLPTNSPVAMAIGNGESENARSNALTIGWNGSLAQGNTAVASGVGSYAAGAGVTASGAYSHAEGVGSVASGDYSHAEGSGGAQATTYGAHAEGMGTRAAGSTAHAEGTGTTASLQSDHAEGTGTTAQGGSSHAEGNSTHANGSASHAEGQGTTASGMASHAEGNNTEATNVMTHAEGYMTHATGVMAHAEGNKTTASGTMSHAEGSQSVASGQMSHAEGNSTIANASFSHAGGLFNEAMTLYPDWTANTAYEVGDRVNNSGSGYECVTANSDATWTAAKWKVLPSNSDVYYAIGNGNSTARSNAMELKWNGDMALQGDMTLFKGTANEFNVSSLKDAGGVMVVNLAVDAQDVVTSDTSLSDILAAFEADKSIYGCLTMSVQSGVTVPGTFYAPLTAMTLSGGIMQLVLGKFELGEMQIWINGVKIPGKEVSWSSSRVFNMTAMSSGASVRPTNYSAGNLPITDLGTPTANTDAATKQYVDNSILSQTGLSVVNGQLCISYEEESA